MTANIIRKIDNARVKLSKCTTMEDVEKVFSEFEITDYPTKIAFLRCCMQIQKAKETPDTAANDKDAYESHAAIFLSGEWKETNQTREPTIPDSGSSLSSVGNKKQSKETNVSTDMEKLYKDINVSEKTRDFFEKFYKMNIIPRMQKKYLAQLISVIEDMIEEKIREQEKKQKPIPENRKTDRYRINLVELILDSGSERKTNTASCICFPRFSVIFFNPTLEVEAIRASIAHELGHLLLLYRVIKCDNDANAENYANLFAYLAVKEENSL
jgi:hypothetical protein